ncbi:ArsR/SmtB family transcription factor [Zunongwangia endophytica]|uniref:ArsR/SmtB family transcription factor n=1 Tax=Zunongwangia endophytica TaxID=1808945 RepID=A0ABV8H6D9_9FLAO|nr:metalloregulator ArsR/SmtB family transcription factor [Zunongwangia endophytica]MDN3595080.1 metalloregulator ArsR/SmtB family transcription factor [Zunongwangia endophytica]
MNLKEVEKIAKALSDRNRLLIMKAIQKNEGKLDCSAIVDSLDLSQPSISHHIKRLVEADLIIPYKEGRFYFYSLNQNILNDYLATLKNLQSFND